MDDLQRRGGRLGVDADVQGADGLPDGDVVRLPQAVRCGRVAQHDAHAGAALTSQRHRDEVVESLCARDVLVFGRDAQRHPVVGRRARRCRHGELEVDPVGVVGDEHLVPERLDVVLDALSSLGHDTRRAQRVVGIEQAELARGLGPDRDEDEAVVARAADPDEEALVGLLVDEHVVLGRSADLVTPHLVGSPGVVDPRVEEVSGIEGPREGSPGLAHGVIEDDAVLDAAHAHVVAFVADDVDGIRQQVAGRATPRSRRRRRTRGRAPPRSGRAAPAHRQAASAVEGRAAPGDRRRAPAPPRRTAPPRRCASSTTSGRAARAPRGRSPRCASGTPRRPVSASGRRCSVRSVA